MGQATADLPASTTPEGESNADALLSQLAGEEIDRLLAEADVSKEDSTPPLADPPPPMVDDLPVAASTESTPVLPADPAVADVASDPVIKEMPPELSKEALDNEITTSLEAQKPADKTDEKTAAQFDAQVNKLFDELKELPEEKPPTPAAADIPPHAPVEAAHVNVGAIAAELDQTSRAERAALNDPKPAAAPVDAKPSLLVRLLEVVNAPVNSLPESLRDALGKIAILTLMNAIGVFLYLMLFRK